MLYKNILLTVLLLMGLVILPISLKSQQVIKVKKEDNRFLFFQVGAKNDTIIKNKTDLFLIHIPDSLKKILQIQVQNGRFIKTEQDSIFKLIAIKGMKYSHTKIDTAFNTLLEGTYPGSKNIDIKLINRQKNKVILQNHFIVK